MAPLGTQSSGEFLLGELGLLRGAVTQLDDDELYDFLAKHPGVDGASFLEALGGLRGCEATHPRAYAVMRARLGRVFGTAVFARVYASDQRLVQTVHNAAFVVRRLEEAQRHAAASEEPAAYAALEADRVALRLGYPEIFRVFAAADAEEPTPASELPPLEERATAAELLWDALFADGQALAAERIESARVSQESIDARVALGAQAVGERVGQIEGLVVNTNVNVTAILAPRAGLASLDEAIARARLAGRGTAVVRRRDLLQRDWHFICGLDEELPYSTVFGPSFYNRSNLIVSGSLDVWAITTDQGIVLVADQGRFMGQLAARPELYLDGDGALAEADAALIGVFQPPTDVIPTPVDLRSLFGNTALDLALLNLLRSEVTLRRERSRFTGPSSDAGAALQQATATLRTTMLGEAQLAWDVRERTMSQLEKERTLQLMATKGRVVAGNRAAALGVRVNRAADATQRPVDEEFEDLLAGQAPGNAAMTAIAEIDHLLENIETARLYLLSHYPETRAFVVGLHPAAFSLFSPRQRSELQTPSLRDFLELVRVVSEAIATQRTVLLLLLVAALGGPVVALAVGLSFAFDSLQAMGAGFERAQAIAAMTAVDIPDGFQLATPEDASSARFWAWVGVGFAVLDVLQVGFDVGAVLRRAVGVVPRGVAPLVQQPPAPTPGLLTPMPTTAAALGPVALAHALTKLTRSERLADEALRQVARELKIPRTRLLREVMLAATDAARSALVRRMRQAALSLTAGGSTAVVRAEAVIQAGVDAPIRRGVTQPRVLLLGAESAPEFAWGAEQALAGRQVVALGPSAAEAAAVVNAGGEFVQGGLDALSPAREFELVREELLRPVTLPATEPFVVQRLARLAPGGRWLIVTESADLADEIARAAPRREFTSWRTATLASGAPGAVTRHVIVVARERAGTRVALSGFAQTTRYANASLLAADLASLNAAGPGRLWARLDELRRAGVSSGQVWLGQLNVLKGNIGEILAEAYKATILGLHPDGRVERGLRIAIRRADDTLSVPVLFTDDLLVREAAGNLEILEVFEIKAGERGGQEATSQIFEWIEGELTEGSELILSDGRRFRYDPDAAGAGRVIGLAAARRHIVTAKGVGQLGRRSEDQVAATVVRHELDWTAADINYLARRLLEAPIPPPP